MLLDVDNAVPYLLERGYLAARDVIDGGVRVTSVSRRNRNLRVTRGDGTGFLVKQAEAVGSEATLGCEAAFYRMCAHDDRAAAMRPYAPTMVGVEEADRALFIELIGDAVPLTDLRGRYGDAALLVRLGRAIGLAVGTCHRAFPTLVEHPSRHADRLGRQVPWVLWVHRPGPEILDELSAGNRKTLHILQQRGDLARRLDVLRRGWRVETLIHGDLKADNLLIAGDVDGDPTVKLVDWELAQLGDPAWDLGALLRDFVLAWIFSMPVGRGIGPEEMIAAAAHPLAGVQVGMRALWVAYLAAAEPRADHVAGLRLRAAGYAGALMIQTAYEHTQRASRLGNHEVLMLQVAANVLADPADAALALFGIPDRGARR